MNQYKRPFLAILPLHYFIGLGLSLFFLTQSASAQESLTITQAVERGLKNNYDILLVKFSQEIATNNNTWGNAGRLPRVDLSVSGSTFGNPTSFATGGRSLSAGASANWILFDGFRIYATKDRLQLLENQSGQNAAVIVETTVQAIMLAYFNVLIAQEQEKVLQNTIEVSRKRLAFEKRKKELGNATSFQTIQFERAVISDSISLIQQKQNIRNALRNLNLTMGEAPETEFVLTDKLQTDFSNYQLDDLQNQMLSNNQNVKNQLINLQIAAQDIRLAQASLYPTVSINGSGEWSTGFTQLRGGDSFSASGFQYNAGFSIAFNLFNGGNTRRIIENAEINQMIERTNLDDLKNDLSHQLTGEFETYELRRQLLELQESSIAISKESLDLSESRFRSGLINSIDLNDVRLQYRNAQLSKLVAIRDLQESLVQLMRLTGGLIQQYPLE